MKKIIPTPVFVALFLTAAFAQNGTNSNFTGFLMLEEPINPRNIAMGASGTALGGAGFRYYNPAAPFLTTPAAAHVAVEFGQMPGGVNGGGFETAVVFDEWFTGASFHTSAVDYQTTDERGPGAHATANTTFGAATFGYVKNNAAVALSFNMAEDRITTDATYGALAAGVGLAYKMFESRLNFGAAFYHHVSWNRGFNGNGRFTSEGDYVPRFVRGGAAFRDTVFAIPYTVAADVVYGSAGESVTVPIGVDAAVLPFLNIRAGKRIGWDNEVMSFGIGLIIDKVSFDAAFVPTRFVNDYEMKWSMAFTYNL